MKNPFRIFKRRPRRGDIRAEKTRHGFVVTRYDGGGKWRCLTKDGLFQKWITSSFIADNSNPQMHEDVLCRTLEEADEVAAKFKAFRKVEVVRNYEVCR